MPEVEAFEAHLGELRRVRRFIRQVCQGLGEEWVGRVLVVVDEAFANIISHGETSEAIFISLDLEGDRVIVELWDRGVSFDPKKAPVPDLSEGQEHGMGLVILHKLANGVAYTPKGEAGDWNRLRLSIRGEDGSSA